MNLVIDSKSYEGVWVRTPIKRKAVIRDTENTGWLLSGEYRRDIVGTYYSYSVVLDMLNATASTYAELYEVLTAPDASHYVTLPYGQGAITIKAYIDSVSDDLVKMRSTNIWNNLRVTFIAAEPYRRPS